jgi:hypothetical protein
MHHPRVRTLLFGKTGAAACPHFAAGPDLDEKRRTALAGLAGTTAAPEKRLFGLAIGRDARKDVRAWADGRKLRCDNVDGDAMRCARSTAVLGVESDLYLRFAGETLVAIDAVGSAPADDPMRAYRAVHDDIAANYGPAHDETTVGDVAKAGRVASVWRFAELAIDVSVFSTGDAPRVRMQLRWLR